MKNLTTFQKVALASLLSVILLMFVGAIVRATGSGMGCPDWPKCWGKYIPPTEASQIDVSTLPIEKYKRYRERHGGNPDDITHDTVLAEFNPVHTWVEFTNRLCSLPVGIFSLLTMILSFRFLPDRKWIFRGSFFALFLVGLNAWMGARIVYSGLQPGTITTHMALAILLLCVQVALVWAGGERDTQARITFSQNGDKIKLLGMILFGVILIEGILGSQVREMTDLLQKSHATEPRSAWIWELEDSWVYLIHRSFSWVILITSVFFYAQCKQWRVGGLKWQEHCIMGIVIAQMVLGLILSQVGILRVVQVLHIGLSSILACSMFTWLLMAWSKERKMEPRLVQSEA